MTTSPRDPHAMVPIWLIIGATILVYGAIIAAVGVADWNHPAPHVAMARLHADFWWGLFMVAVGLVYTIRFRPGRRRQDGAP